MVVADSTLQGENTTSRVYEGVSLATKMKVIAKSLTSENTSYFPYRVLSLPIYHSPYEGILSIHTQY